VGSAKVGKMRLNVSTKSDECQRLGKQDGQVVQDIRCRTKEVSPNHYGTYIKDLWEILFSI